MSDTTESTAPVEGARRRPSPMALLSLGIGAVLAVGLITVVSILTGGKVSNGSAPTNALVGKKVAAFTLHGLDGGAVDAPWKHGHAGVVIFFASWCGPCQREMPHVAAYLRAHPPVGATVVGVDALDVDANARSFITRTGVPFAVGADHTGAVITSEFGFRTVPETVFVNAHGVVTNVYLGAIPQARLVAGLRALGATP